MGKPSLPKKLNICIVTRQFSIKGRAADNSFLWPIAKGLADKGHHVVVLSSQGPSDTSYDGISVHYLANPESDLKRYPLAEAVKRKFVELHEKDRFHIVHSIDTTGAKIAKFKKQLRVAVAFDVKATQMSQIFSILGMAGESVRSMLLTGIAVAYKYMQTFLNRDRKILKSADGVFVTSPRQRIVLERYYFYADAKIHTVPYGIEVGDLSPREQSQELKEKFGIPPDGHVAVTFTDMTSINEIQSILRAFEIVAIKKPKSRLIIVGNGPMRTAVEKEMYDLALGSKVILTGAVPNSKLADYVALSDVFIDISVKSTGFEPSMLEAMAQKKVIIGSEVGAISSIVEDGAEGFLIRPADIQSLSSLLLDIFTGRLQTLEIGDRARRKVTNLFDLDKMVEETIRAYFRILKQTKFYRKS